MSNEESKKGSARDNPNTGYQLREGFAYDVLDVGGVNLVGLAYVERVGAQTIEHYALDPNKFPCGEAGKLTGFMTKVSAVVGVKSYATLKAWVAANHAAWVYVKSTCNDPLNPWP